MNVNVVYADQFLIKVGSVISSKVVVQTKITGKALLDDASNIRPVEVNSSCDELLPEIRSLKSAKPLLLVTSSLGLKSVIPTLIDMEAQRASGGYAGLVGIVSLDSHNFRILDLLPSDVVVLAASTAQEALDFMLIASCMARQLKKTILVTINENVFHSRTKISCCAKEKLVDLENVNPSFDSLKPLGNSNFEAVAFDLESRSFISKAYKSLDHGNKPVGSNVVIAAGMDYLLLNAVVRNHASKGSVSLLKLNVVKPCGPIGSSSLFSNVSRILLACSEEKETIVHDILSNLYESFGEKGYQSFQIFSANIVPVCEMGSDLLTSSYVDQIIEEFVSVTPDLARFKNLKYNDELYQADRAQAYKPDLRNDLVQKLLVFSNSPHDSILPTLLGSRLNLHVDERATISCGGVYQTSLYFGSVEDFSAFTNYPPCNVDVVGLDSLELLFSSTPIASRALSCLKPDGKLVINCNWASDSDILKNLSPEVLQQCKLKGIKIVAVDAAEIHARVNSSTTANVFDVALLEVAESVKSGYNFNQLKEHLKELYQLDISRDLIKELSVSVDLEAGVSSHHHSPLPSIKIDFKPVTIGFVSEKSQTTKSFDPSHVLKHLSGTVLDTDSNGLGLNHLFGKHLVSPSSGTTWLVSQNEPQASLIGSIHTVMESERDINVLVLLNGMSRTLKDIGLYCMHYGNTYVAATDFQTNKGQFVHAISEAQRFKGPAVVLCGIGLEPKGWALYRWNPNETDDFKFKVDSESIKKEMREFLDADSQLTLLSKQQFQLPSAFDQSLESKYAGIEQKLINSFDKLQANLDVKEPQEVSKGEASEEYTLVIIYGSDSGNAQSVAEKLAKKAQLANAAADEGNFNRIKKIRCCEANEYSEIEKLAEFDFEDPALEEPTTDTVEEGGVKQVSIFEQPSTNEVDSKAQIVEESNETSKVSDSKANKLVVLIVLSTAGQGEPTMNAKGFTENLLSFKSQTALKNMNYAVFGLGDSHYWGKGTSDSEKYFCKIAKDVDNHLTHLNAPKLCTSQFGDDQDDDGYGTMLDVFERELWEKLNLNVPKNVGSDAPEIVDDDLKTESNFLRGNIDDGLNDHTTLKILPEDAKLTKFHGIYQQDLRSVREELDAQHLERAYSFMIRIGIPGGVCGIGQLLKMMDICDTYANKKLKLTTRQAFQLHGVVKKDLKTTMQAINRYCMDTLAACGDVNRNIIANPHIHSGQVYKIVSELAHKLNVHLKPRTSAYHEIWLDKKKLISSPSDYEPIYGKTYLPRKFKIAIAVPPSNDVDVFAHCLGFIAICDHQGNLEGFNISIGGGMGTTHNDEATYPKLAPLLGFVKYDSRSGSLENFIKVAEAIVILQRDYGERKNRKHARLKYTVEDHGVDFFKKNVEQMTGIRIEPSKQFKFERNADDYGWKKSKLTGKWSYTMFVENGVVYDTDRRPMKTGLRHIAEFLNKVAHEQFSNSSETDVDRLVKITGAPNFSMTATQNLILGEIPENLKSTIDDLLVKYKLNNECYSNLRLHSMACVALPTCALAMAEAQTYLPDLLDKVEKLLDDNGIANSEIVMRMTGCPNGCARPYIAEIALVGKAPGQYNLYLGGGYGGNRLNKMYKEGIDEDEILKILGGLFERYAKERKSNDGGRVERFGDWCIRSGTIEPTLDGKYFWKHGEENVITDKLQVYW